MTKRDSQACDHNAASLAARKALKRSTDLFQADYLSEEENRSSVRRVVNPKTNDADHVLSVLPVFELRADSFDQAADSAPPLIEQEPIQKKAKKSRSSDNDVIKLMLTKTDQIPESELPFFEFTSDARNQSHLWETLEEKLNEYQGRDDELCLLKDLHTQLEIKLPSALLWSLVARFKICSQHTQPLKALDFEDLTRSFQMVDRRNNIRTIPVAMIWEASKTLRDLYSDCSFTVDNATKNLLLPIDQCDVSSLPDLFDPDPVYMEKFNLPELYNLWDQANYLDASKITAKIINAIGKKIDAYSVETLNNEDHLQVLNQICVLAKQTNCHELREKLDALVQRWFDNASRELQKISGKAIKKNEKQNLCKQWSTIANCLQPVSLKTHLTKTEIKLIKRATCIDTLECLDIGDAELKNFVQSSSIITRIFIKSSKITDAGLVHIRALKALRILDLTDCKLITDAGLAHIGVLTALQELNLRFCNLITDDGLAHISELKAMQKLDLMGCNLITDAGLAHISTLEALQQLNFMGCILITDVGLAHISVLTALQQLNLMRCNLITDAGLAHISNLKALRILDLNSCKLITEAGLAHISGLKALQILYLGYCNLITDAGLAHISALKFLQKLYLSGSNSITDAGLAHISTLKALQKLYLVGCNLITENARIRFRQINPRIEFFLY